MDDGQRLLVPAYFYPGGTQWLEMSDALEQSGAEAVLIMNPASGPGTFADPNYVEALARCSSKGQTVIGYVTTSYRKRTLPSVKAEIDEFFRLYPGLGGIFVDEMSNETAPSIKRYYRRLYKHVKAISPDALVVANPGVPALTPWQVTRVIVADVLVVYEGPAEEYRTWEPPDWITSRDASRFAQLVYKTTDPAMTTAVCAESVDKNAGWIFVTEGVMPNPWNVPPDAAMYECPSLARRPVSAG